jgi:hypothetical protein
VSRQQKIREWLATQDGPRTSRDICNALKGEEAIKVQWAIGVMLRDGMLERVRHTRPMTYVLVRGAMTKAETLVLCGEGRDKRNESLKEWRKAERARKAAEREAVRQQAEVANAARRAESRRLYEIKRNERRKLLRVQTRPTRVGPSRPLRDPPVKLIQPAPWERPSTDEFIANGGQVQRLDPGATSRPFKHIGRAA